MTTDKRIIHMIAGDVEEQVQQPARPVRKVIAKPAYDLLKAIASDDVLAESIGARAAQVLRLRRITKDGNDYGRFETEYGTKTACGLARTLLRIMIEESEKA